MSDADEKFRQAAERALLKNQELYGRLSAGDAIRDARDADDMMEWLSKRASYPREIPFNDVWEYSIRFDVDVPAGEEPPTLREAIRRAMAKERE